MNANQRLQQALAPIEAPLLRGVMALPPRVQRILAGRPIVRDGLIRGGLPKGPRAD